MTTMCLQTSDSTSCILQKRRWILLQKFAQGLSINAYCAEYNFLRAILMLMFANIVKSNSNENTMQTPTHSLRGT